MKEKTKIYIWSIKTSKPKSVRVHSARCTQSTNAYRERETERKRQRRRETERGRGKTAPSIPDNLLGCLWLAVANAANYYLRGCSQT